MANTLEKLRTSITGKVLMIGLLILALLIPMNLVESVIAGRSIVYRSAEESITGAWGKDILLLDPLLTVDASNKLSWSNGAYIYDTQYQHLGPEKLSIHGHIETQVRKRGIFKVPVYTGNIRMQGHYTLPQAEPTAIDIRKQARFQILLNSRSLKSPPELIWNGEKIPMTAEKAHGANDSIVFSARLDNVNEMPQHSFELSFTLTGSTALTFLSKSRHSEIHLTSNWDSPGFFGTSLPVSHNINKEGFCAEWKTNNFLVDLGHENSETIAGNWFQNEASFGVKFIQPVDTYQLVTRATKYAVLFLTLIFAVYLLYEFLGNVILHPMQYILIGFSNCIFYLLLLSTAEHIDFSAAYFINAFASVIPPPLAGGGESLNPPPLSGRGRVINPPPLSGRGRGGGVMQFILVKLSVLYTFLYTTLKSEDYALLIGSIGLFTILSLIMYFTRNFNWYRTAGESV